MIAPASSSNRLPVLAEQIKEAHAGVFDAAKTAADCAIEAGRALIEAKMLVAHGGWAPWLIANVGFSERTARRYMQIAQSGLETATVADLGIRGAAEALARGSAWIEAPRSEIVIFESGARDYRRPFAIIAPRSDGYFDIAVLNVSDVVTLCKPVAREGIDPVLHLASNGALERAQWRIEKISNGTFGFLRDFSKIEGREGTDAALAWGKSVAAGCIQVAQGAVEDAVLFVNAGGAQ
ncbi:MAG: DUF3102 domain-containing protein [Roseiarcus sp.]|jgi:hypothetical protein